MVGRDIVLNGPAERIISLVVQTGPTVVAIDDSPEHLVGVNPGITNMFRKGVLGKIFPEALTIDNSILQANTGMFAPNVEAIAALQPDMIIQSGFNRDDIVQPLLNASLNTALYMWGTEAQAREINTMIGAIVGRPDRTDALNAWRQDTMDRLAVQAEGVTEPVRAVQISQVEGGYWVWGSDTVSATAIELAGGPIWHQP